MHYYIASAEIGSLHKPLEESLATLERALEIGRRIRGVVFCCSIAAEIALRFGDLNSARKYARLTAESARNGSGDVVNHAAAHKLISLDFLEGDLPAARDQLNALLHWRSTGALSESFRAGVGVLIGMHMGDVALVDALFDLKLLDRAMSKGDADSCGVLLPAFAEIMHVRGMHEDLNRAIKRCIQDGLVDPYCWIQITAARFGPAECLALAARQMEGFLRGAVAPVAPAHTALFNALVARRNGRRSAARAHGLDAAARYRKVGWRLWEASALEAAGDLVRAGAIYQQCGASAAVVRLAAAQMRRTVRAPFGGHLTPRELEIARLLVRKWSNKDIARALAISVRTVDHHAEAVFSKLGINSRWQLNEAVLEGVSSR